MLTLVLHNSGGENAAAHLPSPSRDLGRATDTRAGTGNRPASFSSCSMRGEERWGTATEHAHSPKYTCVCLLMHIYSHHYLKITFEELWATNTTSSFIQYALNSCQRSGTWSWNTKFSYVVSESFISLLDRFSDVQLCFLYTKVQYFLHMLCKQTRRHWKQ